jgi:hypothetical protein
LPPGQVTPVAVRRLPKDHNPLVTVMIGKRAPASAPALLDRTARPEPEMFRTDKSGA